MKVSRRTLLAGAATLAATPTTIVKAAMSWPGASAHTQRPLA